MQEGHGGGDTESPRVTGAKWASGMCAARGVEHHEEVSACGGV
jgi:hypothetical protein